MALPSFKDLRTKLLERETKKESISFGDFMREKKIERPPGQPDILSDLIKKETTLPTPSSAVFGLVPPKEEPLPSILETKTPSIDVGIERLPTFKDLQTISTDLSESLRQGTLTTAGAVESILAVGAKKVGLQEVSYKLSTLAENDLELAKVGINVIDAKKFSEGIKDPRWIVRGIGRNLPNLLLSMGVGIPAVVAGAPTIVTGGLLFGTAAVLEGGFAYNEAKNFGLEDEKAEKVAGVVGIANGMLESLPITKFFFRSPVGEKIKQKIIAKITKRVLEQSVLESGTESLQEIVSNAVASTYDEDRELFAGVPESAFFGGILGGGIQAITDVGAVVKPGLTIEEVGPEEIESVLSQYDKFRDIPAGELIKEPNKSFKVSKLKESDQNIIGAKTSDIGISNKSIKHISEKPEKFPRSVVENISNIVSSPDEIRISNRKNRFAFIKKESGAKATAIIVEVGENTTNVVTAFKGKFKDIAKMSLAPIRDGGQIKDIIAEPEKAVKGKTIEVGPLEALAKPKTIQGILKQEAESLKQIEDDLGITTLPKPGFEGEQFIRVSEHTQRFKTFFKQNKRVPTSLADWKQIAELELDAGRSSIGLADEHKRLKGVKPEEELDIGDIFQEIKKDDDLKKKIEASLITTKQKETFLKSLSTEIKDKLARVAKKGRGLGPLETIQVGKALETFIRKGTLEEKVIKKTEAQLLKERLRSEARGARSGFKHGRKVTRENILTQLRQEKQDITNIRKDITSFAKENLSTKDRGKANVIIRDAKTQKDMAKAFVRINRWAEEAEKKRVRNEIIKVQKIAIKSPTLAIDYKDRINEALNEFELRGHTQKTLDRLESTKKYIDERAQTGEDVELPRRIFDALNILARTPFDEIPLRTLEATLTEIKLLDKIGRTKWRSKEALYNAEKEALKTAILDDVTSINKSKKIKPEIGEKLTLSQKFKNIISEGMDKANRIDKVITPIDVLMDILDGGKGTYDGAHMRLVKGKVDYDFNRYLNLKDSLQDSVSKLAKDLGLKKQNFERIGIVAAREQKGGIDKLKNNGFTEEQIKAVTLTNQERQLLDKMREVMNSKFPEVTKIMKDLYNQPIGKVENYFSFLTDWNAMDDAEVFKRMGPSVEEFGTPTKNVEAGFTKERKSATEQKIQIDAMNVFMKHTDNVSYLVSMAKDAKMIFEVINSKEYQESAGDLGQLLMLEWTDLVVRKGGKAGASQIALLDILRKNIGAGILGLKISSTAIQWTALVDGMGMIGPTWGTLGVKNVATSKSWREFILKFPEIRERAGGETVIREMIEGSFFTKLQSKGFIPLQMVDRITAMSVASGAYAKRMSELGLDIDLTKEPNKQAMEYAQLVVRRTQSSSLFKDVPLAVSRGALTGNRSLDRAIFQFQNFLLSRWSRIEHDAIRVGIKTKNVKQSVNVLFWITLASLLATGTRMAVRRMIDFLLGKEDDEELVEEATRSMMYEVLGTVPFLGNIFGSYMFDSELLPILQAPSGVIQGAKRTISGQSINTKAKGVNQFITSLMKIGGIPGAAQAEQIIRDVIPEDKKKKKFFKEIESFPSFKKDIKFPSFKNIGF